jgi:anthranilate synthase component 1
VVADTVTPIGASLCFHEQGRGDFLLESAEGGETRGRYSLLGLDPDLVFRAKDERAELNRDWQRDRTAFEPCEESALAALRRLRDECLVEVPEGLPPALACLVGYFSFETASLVERLPRAPKDPLQLPDMLFVRPTLLCVFDRLTETVFVIAPVWPKTNRLDEPVDSRLARAASRIDRLIDRLGTQRPSADERSALNPDALELRSITPPGRYREMVLKAKEHIEQGDIFQIVLAQRYTAPFDLPPLHLYRALRRINPSPPLSARPARLRPRRIEPGNPGAGSGRAGHHTTDRRNAPPVPRCPGGSRG